MSQPVAQGFRLRTRPELQGLIGLFMNTVVLRVDLSGGPTFRDLLPRLRDTVLDLLTRGAAEPDSRPGAALGR